MSPAPAVRRRTAPALAVLAVCASATALGMYGLLRPAAPEAHCRIEVYADGSAQPLCEPGWQPTQPIDRWPIVRIEV